jgi:uncharacterized protein (DUF1697 family)
MGKTPFVVPEFILSPVGMATQSGKPSCMTIHIALLRAVNVAGRTVAMAELKALFTGLGFANATTLLQSGNVIFDSDARAGTELESLLERATGTRLGLSTPYLVRTAAEWKALINRNPFPDEATNDPSHLLVMPLKSAPAKEDLAALQKTIKGREVVRGRGRELYIVYPDGVGRSALTVPMIEKKLDTRGTCRNWNTVRKLQAMVETMTTGTNG